MTDFEKELGHSVAENESSPQASHSKDDRSLHDADLERCSEWCRKWHPNGQLKIEGLIVRDKRHGTWKTWDDDGKLKETEQYKFGTLHGMCEIWHPNRQLEVRRNYVDGVLQGAKVQWHANGQMYVRSHGRNGLNETWDKNGQLTSRIWLIDGKEHGLCLRRGGMLPGSLMIAYYDMGHRLSEIKYRRGIKLLAVRIALCVNLHEKMLSILVAEYADLPGPG